MIIFTSLFVVAVPGSAQTAFTWTGAEGSDWLDAVDLAPGTTTLIDTNGLDATWGGNLESAGLHQIDFGGSSLVKAGASTLTLSGTSRVLDTFATVQGTTRQTAGATTAVELMAGSGTGSSAAYQMDGGTLTIGGVDQGRQYHDRGRVVPRGGFRRDGNVHADGGHRHRRQQRRAEHRQPRWQRHLQSPGRHADAEIPDCMSSVARITVRPASQGVLNISGGSLLVQNGGLALLGNNVANANSGFSATLNRPGARCISTAAQISTSRLSPRAATP